MDKQDSEPSTSSNKAQSTVSWVNDKAETEVSLEDTEAEEEPTVNILSFVEKFLFCSLKKKEEEEEEDIESGTETEVEEQKEKHISFARNTKTHNGKRENVTYIKGTDESYIGYTPKEKPFPVLPDPVVTEQPLPYHTPLSYHEIEDRQSTSDSTDFPLFRSYSNSPTESSIVDVVDVVETTYQSSSTQTYWEAVRTTGERYDPAPTQYRNSSLGRISAANVISPTLSALLRNSRVVCGSDPREYEGRYDSIRNNETSGHYSGGYMVNPSDIPSTSNYFAPQRTNEHIQIKYVSNPNLTISNNIDFSAEALGGQYHLDLPLTLIYRGFYYRLCGDKK